MNNTFKSKRSKWDDVTFYSLLPDGERGMGYGKLEQYPSFWSLNKIEYTNVNRSLVGFLIRVIEQTDATRFSFSSTLVDDSWNRYAADDMRRTNCWRRLEVRGCRVCRTTPRSQNTSGKVTLKPVCWWRVSASFKGSIASNCSHVFAQHIFGNKIMMAE